ncbi:unnamed protein product [Blepharisma stoltei]|uniref:Uncharacterized protein n=1 Tax=Blepharisma stoltei TaxID=1481888 RepID=A0AAU9J6H5_9CILI|nr:unnamed protein product [Blepharisma stoltei]
MISKLFVILLCSSLISASEDFQNKFFSLTPSETSCTDPNSIECAVSLISNLAQLLSESNFFTIEDDAQISNLKSSVNDFMSGLIKGLQKDPTKTSTCATSIATANTALTTCIDNFSIALTKICNTIYNLNDFINKFTASYDLCAFQTLIDLIQSLDTQKGFSQLLVHYGVNYNTINLTFEDFIIRMQYGDFEAQGEDIGKIIRLLSGWSI